MGIDTVFFDIGGVLCSGSYEGLIFKAAAEASGVSKEMAHEVVRNHWIPFALGLRTEREFWSGVRADLALPRSVDELVPLPYQRFALSREVYDIAAGLSDKTRVGVISNHSNEWSDYIISTYHLDQLFDPIIISSRVGLRKPGFGIYRLACERAGVFPDSAAFIDDQEENVAAARLLGMEGIVYENPEQLRAALARLP